MEPSVIVIGITGPTRCGKGRVSKALAETLGNVAVVGQDAHWFRPWPDAATGEASAEEPECTDHAKFAEKIQEATAAAAASGARFVIAEGYQLLHDASVRALLGPIHWLQISRDECIRRRSAPRDELRNPHPIDATKMKRVVWPAYLRYCTASVDPLGARVRRHVGPSTEDEVAATVSQILASLPVEEGIPGGAEEERPGGAMAPAGDWTTERPLYITNVGHPSFLDCTSAQGPGKYDVTMWGDGVDVGEYPDYIQWILKPVEGEVDTFFILNKAHNKFLDSHGRGVWLWGDGVDIGQDPDGIKWRREVAGAGDTFYLIHKKSNKFLDSPGGPQVSLWGDGVNTGEIPQNLQWQLKRAGAEWVTLGGLAKHGGKVGKVTEFCHGDVTLWHADGERSGFINPMTLSRPSEAEATSFEAAPKMLFHGTSLENAVRIQDGGFDLARCGTGYNLVNIIGGSKLGRGVYMGEEMGGNFGAGPWCYATGGEIYPYLNVKENDFGGCVLKLSVDTGRVYQVTGRTDPLLTRWAESGYDSVYKPAAVAIHDTSGDHGNHHQHMPAEYCIADPARIKVVGYSITDEARKAGWKVTDRLMPPGASENSRGAECRGDTHPAYSMCFNPDARVRMADGTAKHAKAVQVGDQLATPTGESTTVLACTIQASCRRWLVQIEDMYISTMHRIQNPRGEWIEPIFYPGATMTTHDCALHNFVVEGSVPIIVCDVVASTIGTYCVGSHDFQWPTHELWGGHNIVNLFAQRDDWPNIRIGVSNTFLAVMKNPEFARKYLDQCDGTKRSTRMLLREYGWIGD
eukprot:COSAG02_NODE_501_length_21049_cov_34.002768_2_plen_803_part_00